MKEIALPHARMGKGVKQSVLSVSLFVSVVKILKSAIAVCDKNMVIQPVCMYLI